MCKNLFLMEITLGNGHWMDPARGHPSLSRVHPMANIWYIYIHTHILHNHPYIFAHTSFSMTHTLTHTHLSQSHTHISFTIISSTPKFNYSILNPLHQTLQYYSLHRPSLKNENQPIVTKQRKANIHILHNHQHSTQFQPLDTQPPYIKLFGTIPS